MTELEAIQSLQNLFNQPITRAISVFSARWLVYGLVFIIPPVVWNRPRIFWRQTLDRVVGSLLLALGSALILEKLIRRARPFNVTPAITAWIPLPTTFALPSAHASAAFALALALTFSSPRWGALALVLATLVALGRVITGVHYPSDVLAGAVLGCLSACVINYLAPRYRRWLRRPINTD